MQAWAVGRFRHYCVGAGDMEDVVDLVHRTLLSRSLHGVFGFGELAGAEGVGIWVECHHINSCSG